MELLKEIQPGDKSLLFPEEANKLIRAINAILSLEVVPAAAGTIKFEQGKSTLDIKATRGGGVSLPAIPSTGVYVLGTNGSGALTWIATTATCPT